MADVGMHLNLLYSETSDYAEDTLVESFTTDDAEAALGETIYAGGLAYITGTNQVLFSDTAQFVEVTGVYIKNLSATQYADIIYHSLAAPYSDESKIRLQAGEACWLPELDDSTPPLSFKIRVDMEGAGAHPLQYFVMGSGG